MFSCRRARRAKKEAALLDRRRLLADARLLPTIAFKNQTGINGSIGASPEGSFKGDGSHHGRGSVPTAGADTRETPPERTSDDILDRYEPARALRPINMS